MGIVYRIKAFLTKISPKLESTLQYRWTFGEWPDWHHPQNLYVKLQKLKLNEYYHNDEITTCVDKYKVFGWLREKGYDYLNPMLYGVYSNPSEIDFDSLPNQYVIKCNHGSGMNIIVANKEEIDVNAVKKTIEKMDEDRLLARGRSSI